MRYTIALGGNIGDPEETFERAMEKLASSIGSIVAISSYYWTKPLIHPNAPVRQALYLNAVVQLESEDSPHEVLEKLFAVERSLGRVRENEQIPWGPRTIDLDLIAAEDLIIFDEVLTLPHPQMHLRDFVLLPMAELGASWSHPVQKKNLTELIDCLDERWIIEKARPAAGRQQAQA